MKLTDFGIARSLADASESLTQHVSGHAGYMAPEQACAQPFDTRADLFPVGVIAWELLAQRRLFGGRDTMASLIALLNDDLTPMEFVVRVLQDVFGKNKAQAVALMLETHRQGRGTCGVYEGRAQAEAKVREVADLAREHGHPLMCEVGEGG